MIRLKLYRLIFILVFIFSGFFAQAAYFKNFAIKIVQPNGVELDVFATGDEYYNWIHDINNYTIVKNPVNGFYVYALEQNGELMPTSYIVGVSDPAAAGLNPGANIPGWKMELIRQDFLEATPHKPSIVPPFAPLVPNVAGTLNNIVVYIRFSDQTEFTEPITFYDDMFNNNTSNYNSMYNYFKDVSYNTMFVTSSHYPLPNGTLIVSYQDPNNRNYYCPYDSATNPEGYHDNERTSREHTLLKNAVDAVSAEVPPALNVDYDNDGYVDNVCFIIKGTTTAWSTLLWPHRWSLYSQTASINGKQVWDYNLQLETFLAGSGVGVLAHEMTHTFGCPDLYHYNGDGFTPVGPWDLMDNNNNPPQHIGAFMKKKYTGWISSIPTITSPGTYTLNPLASSTNNAYKMVSPNSSTEFFIFEYRKKTGTFEGSLPASGLLIYRINTLAGDGNASGPPDEIYLYRLGGTPTANGQISNGYFSLNSGRTSFNDITNPYDFLSNGTTLGGINITDITATDATISFTVSMSTMAEFTANPTTTCMNQAVTFTDQTLGAPTSWNWSATPATYVFVNSTSASSQNPQIQFTAGGDYSVTLIASGINGTDTMTKTNFIHIISSSAPPLTENFESGLFTTNNWVINNPDGLKTWEIYTGGGGNPGSTKSARLNFYDYSSLHAIDDMISRPIALPGSGIARIIFKVAYRQYNSTYHDSLKVMISTDCGSTFTQTVYNKGDALLATGAPTTSSFVPQLANDWRTDTVNLSQFIGQTIVVKFRTVNGYGNNLYVDDINLTGDDLLSANFTGTPTSLCQGGTVQFTDLSTGSPTGWSWNFGDGNTSTQQSPAHQYNIAGIYTVSLTVTKPGSSNTFTRTNYITVNPLLTVIATINQTPSGTLCANSSVIFNALVTNGGLNPIYQWKKNGVNVGSNSSSYSVSNLSNGDNIVCHVTSNISCPANVPAISNTIQVIVIQNVVPSVNITASPSNIICLGTTVTFTAFPTNGGTNPVYQWKRNGINVGTNANTYISSSLLQGEVITCVMTSNASCTLFNPATSNSITMTVNPILPVSVSITQSPPGQICAGTAVTFNAAVTNGGSNPVYQWKKNGQNVGTNSATYSSSSLANNDQVQCTVISSLGCFTPSPATSNIIVMDVLLNSAVSVSIAASPPGAVCIGTSITFIATPVNGGSNPVYEWFVNGITSGTGISFTSNVLPDATSVYCVLTSNISSCTTGNPATSNTIVTDIHNMPVINLGNDTIIPLSSTLLLDPGAGYSDYFWSTGAFTQTLLVSSSGQYSVTVTDNAGCSGIDTINVTVGYSSLQGQITYFNTAASHMDSTTVQLKQGSTIIATTVTDNQGYYYFSGLALGSYKVSPSCVKLWGGVNSADALLIMKHFVGMSYLTGLKLKTANVDLNLAVNAVDALTVQKRTVGIINFFPVGDWTFETPNITINGLSAVIQDVKALTTGDVNGSFVPLTKKSNKVELNESGIICTSGTQKLEIPIYTAAALEAGAITLFIQYPEKDLQLTGISMEQNQKDHLVYSDKKGLISISWAGLQPIYVEEGNVLMTLQFNVLNKLPEGYLLNCPGENEITDFMGIPYENVRLLQPRVTQLLSGGSDFINVAPNPFQDNTSINFTLSEKNNVNLSVYNIQGQKIKILANEMYSAGKHQLNWDGRDDKGKKLSSGVYYVRMLTSGQIKIVPVVLLQ